jgi:ubiquinone/menaquinone biosynthesis C-methylase UbiE
MTFKDVATRYDAWYQTPLGALAHALECEAVFALAGLRPGERAVDIGCGTGIYTLELARLKAHFVCGSAEALPFRSGRFDLTLAVTSLCFVRHPDHAVGEMRRVLRPGSRLVLGELNRFSLWAFLRRLKGLFRETIYQQAHFWSRRELIKLLRRNGFVPDEAQVLLHFPPINRERFLKYYPFFEAALKKILPGTGAFLAMKAKRP